MGPARAKLDERRLRVTRYPPRPAWVSPRIYEKLRQMQRLRRQARRVEWKERQRRNGEGSS